MRAPAPLSPLPRRVQSLKGVAGDIIILEEAAYCDQGLISEVVVPLLSMSKSVLLCISTLLESTLRTTRCSLPAVLPTARIAHRWQPLQYACIPSCWTTT